MSVYKELFEKYPFLKVWVATRTGIFQLEKSDKQAEFQTFLRNQVLCIEEKPWQNLLLCVRPGCDDKIVENQRIVSQRYYTAFWHTPKDQTRQHTHFSGEPENRWSVSEIMISMTRFPHESIVVDAVVLTTHLAISKGRVMSNKYQFAVYPCPTQWTVTDTQMLRAMNGRGTIFHGPAET